MKINSSESHSTEYIKHLDTSRKDIIASKEKEIENTKKYYEKRIDEAKKDGEDRYFNSLEKNNQVLVDSSIDLENRLGSYRDNLKKTQENLQREESILKNDHKERSDLIKKDFEEDIVNKYADAKESEDLIHQKLQNEIHLIDNKSHFEKNKLENNAQREITTLAREFNQKDLDAERVFKNNLENDLRGHQDILRAQKEDFKKMISESEEKNKRLEKEKIRIQTDELKYLDAHQKNLIQQKDQDFKVRYEKITKEHEEILNNLKEKLESDMKKIIADSTKTKNNYTSKASDNFYSMEILKPKIIDTEKAYLVSIQVPEYEKENLHLQAQGRDIKITLSRKFGSPSLIVGSNVSKVF